MKTTQTKMLFAAILLSAVAPSVLFSAEEQEKGSQYKLVSLKKEKDTILQIDKKTNTHNLNPTTQLYVFTIKNDLKSIKKLLISKIDPNAQDKKSDLSLLMHACNHNYLEAAKTLLEYKADPNARQKETGKTALTIASYQANLKMVKLLVKNKANVDQKSLRITLEGFTEKPKSEKISEMKTLSLKIISSENHSSEKSKKTLRLSLQCLTEK